MSNTKTIMSQAANTQGIPLDITDVFSTYLYEGLGTVGGPQSIVNNINLAEEGGLFWAKSRSSTEDGHTLFDTERGVGSQLSSDSTAAEVSYSSSNRVTSFNTDGVTLNGYGAARPSTSYASWTFRKAPKFFDVVTWDGDGVAGREIAHNLGSVPGMIVVKCLNNVTNWAVYHRGVDSTAPEDFVLRFNDTTARVNTSVNWNDTAPTSTNFTLGTNSWVNRSGSTYVAYLFAHNDGDGGFGPDGDADIIKCGSYTGNGSGTAGPTVDLGFEPQWILTKRASGTGYWTLVDAMRGMVVGGDDKLLYPNTSGAEQQSTRFEPSATGFQVNSTNIYVNASGNEYIYMAIRRGPLFPPESATEVFDVDQDDGVGAPAFISGFPVDFNFYRNVNSAQGAFLSSRLTGNKYMQSTSTNAESSSAGFTWDYMDGFRAGPLTTDFYGWMWKRAPNFFDVVAYTGTGSLRTVGHNLGVAPEMIWVKAREIAGGVNRKWAVYSSALGAGQQMWLNTDNAAFTSSAIWANTAPTETSFSVSTNVNTNYSNVKYIAYLFASLPGISKVGSYTGTGTSQTIDCGFTSGARFVLIKNATTTSTQWLLYDSVRGITSGNDPYLLLNEADAENTASVIDIEPQSAGFEVNGTYDWLNKSGDTYIFYAIA